MKPILFNTTMVRAILDGRKTVTRRLVKFKAGQNPQWSGYVADGSALYGSHNIPAVKSNIASGDILYVRETWAFDTGDENGEIGTGCFLYRADDTHNSACKWHPSIHMPKEAARIFLRVKDVRVERLQDISDKQAKAEGIVGRFLGMGYDDPVGAFADLWNKTIKPAELDLFGWYANPWVWVIEFEQISDEEESGL